jgi:predicted dehydrogenase
MCRRGANARACCEQFKAAYATASYEDIINDPNIGAIVIGTRHNNHAELTLKGLQAGKNVFVEKPLALTMDELDQIKAFYQDNTKNKPMLMTGYNRRFSQLMVDAKSIIQERQSPVIINYEVNSGALSPDHWLRTEEGGGRNLGEACHIYDLFLYLIDSVPRNITVSHAGVSGNDHSPNENFTATISFTDGSLATLTYTTLGHKTYPKEHMRGYLDESVLVMNDYEELEFFGPQNKRQKYSGDKGHFAEITAFARAVKTESQWPISLQHQLYAAHIALEVERQITHCGE